MNAALWRLTAAGAAAWLAGSLALGAHAAEPRRKAAVRPSLAPNAEVVSVHGAATVLPAQATVRRRASRAPAPVAARPLTPGTAVREGARIHVPEDGYLRLRLADGSIVRVLAESDVELRRLRRRGRTAAMDTVIDVKRGKVESEVVPSQGRRVFEIHAPGAVASVRGTRFDVSVDSRGRVATGVTEGRVLLQPRASKRPSAGRPTLVGAGQGVVLEPGGRLGPRRALPPAPDLSGLPAESQDATRLVIELGPAQAQAAGHEIRVALDEELHQVVRSATVMGTRAQFPALDDGRYTLGVRALDDQGLAGPESRAVLWVHARPEPPLYLGPAPAARFTAEGGLLQCTATLAAPLVHLQVARDAAFTQLAIDQPRLTDCRLGTAALPPGDYHWRVASVQALPQGGWRVGPFAAAQRFTVAPTPTIGAVAVPTPSEEPTLRWQAEAGTRFRAELARDETFTQVVREAELERAEWTLRGLPPGLYYLRLQAIDDSGLAGPRSATHRVRVGAVLQSPDGGSVRSSDGEPVGRP